MRNLQPADIATSLLLVGIRQRIARAEAGDVPPPQQVAGSDQRSSVEVALPLLPQNDDLPPPPGPTVAGAAGTEKTGIGRGRVQNKAGLTSVFSKPALHEEFRPVSTEALEVRNAAGNSRMHEQMSFHQPKQVKHSAAMLQSCPENVACSMRMTLCVFLWLISAQRCHNHFTGEPLLVQIRSCKLWWVHLAHREWVGTAPMLL